MSGNKKNLSRRGFIRGAAVGSVGAIAGREAIAQEFIETGLTLDDLAGEWWLNDTSGTPTTPTTPEPTDVDDPMTPTPPVEETLNVRRDIYTLPEGSRAIQSLRRGIAEMRRRSAVDPNDPTGWSFQAAIHGGQVGAQVQRCQHRNRFFLSWHRMYLYYFERILRSAANDQSLTLPYWDYSIEGRASLPAVARLPADQNQNPLYWRNRNRFYNDGGALPWPIYLTEPTLRNERFDNFGSVPGFNTQLEREPHDGVHVQIGGSMASVANAGQDPIFWLHHCNVDRQWNRWVSRGGPRRNPEDLEFTSQRFNFYNENRQLVSIIGEDIMNTTNLGYRYDDDPVEPVGVSSIFMAAAPPPPPAFPSFVGGGGLEGVPAPAAAAPQAMVAAQPLLRRASATLAEAAPGIQLGGGRTKVALRVAPQAVAPPPPAALESVPSRPGTARLESVPAPSASVAAAPPTAMFTTAENEISPVILQLQDIAFEKSPGIFNIFVNLPEGTAPDPRGPYFAGYFAPFSQNQTGEPESFDITGLLNRQVERRLWDGNEIDVQFIAIDPAGQVTNVVRDPLSIGQMRIIRE
jgi:tyrosinase